MKKFVIVLFSLLVISFGYCSSAFASTNDTTTVNTNQIQVTDVERANILEKIDVTNVQIQNLIDKAILETSEINIKETKDVSNFENEIAILKADGQGLAENQDQIADLTSKINVYKEQANCAIINVMKNLIKVTDKIATDMANEAKVYGIIVIQEYIPVTINGVVYMVDPLKVSGE